MGVLVELVDFCRNSKTAMPFNSINNDNTWRVVKEHWCAKYCTG